MNRHNLVRCALLVLTLLSSVPDGWAADRDPVEALRRALAVPVTDSSDRAELNFRRANLEKHVKALGAVDLGRALRLQEWRHQDRDDSVATIDQAARDAVVNRLTVLLRNALRSEDATTRRAALTQIGELAELRTSNDRNSLAADFTADVTAALKDKDLAVCRSAALVLGRMSPPPPEAAKALGELLAAEDIARRRAAAEGLDQWLRTLTEMTKLLTYANAPVSRRELAESAAAVLPAAARGAADADLQVRRSCLVAIKRAGIRLNDLILDRSTWEREQSAGRAIQAGSEGIVIVPGREPTEKERRDLEPYLKAVEEERMFLLPLEQGLAAALPAVARATGDGDISVSIAACEALEAIPSGRRRRVAKTDEVAAFRKDKDAKPPEDPLGPALRKTVPALAELTGHKEISVRLAALYALEEYETDAAPAIPAVAKALQDADPFVRWAAVRVLGKTAPKAADAAVPALAKALADENGDVRATAAAALERYGPDAKAAVPALGKAVAGTEAEMRVLAARALAAVGPAAKAAVPALAKALGAPEAEVRYEAARALARVGPAARQATDALRKALDDPDENVRRTASDVLLGLQQE